MITSLGVEGAFVVTDKITFDDRGTATSLTAPFTPAHSLIVDSRWHVVRGLHYQVGMSKLVRCIGGQILDVGVDLRVNSTTYGKHFCIELSHGDGKAVFVPDGVAHGIRVKVALARVLYQCSVSYDPTAEGAVRWDDPDLAVVWGLSARSHPVILSERDRTAPSFAEYRKNPVFKGCRGLEGGFS